MVSLQNGVILALFCGYVENNKLFDKIKLRQTLNEVGEWRRISMIGKSNKDKTLDQYVAVETYVSCC